MPGGGYRWLAIDKEGYELARWLAGRGYTVFVLFYRLPGEGWANRQDVALADAQRAMRLIRSRARDYGIQPKRVAALGFSAGGHLCGDLATRFERFKAAEEILEADRKILSAREQTLKANRESIELAFGGPLDWQEIPGKRACRIKATVSALGYRDEESWPETWVAMADAMTRLEGALRPELAKLK